jgi:hypothetical protein
MTESAILTTTRAQERFVSWTTDVLVYTVVLNLFVEHHRAIEIDSFTISIFTAILLTALLDLIVGVEHAVSAYFKDREGPVLRAVGLVVVFLILFFSKFLILEVVDIVFGDRVELGHILDVIALIVTMIVARKAMQFIYTWLGRVDQPEASSG